MLVQLLCIMSNSLYYTGGWSVSRSSEQVASSYMCVIRIIVSWVKARTTHSSDRKCTIRAVFESTIAVAHVHTFNETLDVKTKREYF